MMSALPSLAISSLIAGVSALDGIGATVSRWAHLGQGRGGRPYFIGIAMIDQSSFLTPGR